MAQLKLIKIERVHEAFGDGSVWPKDTRPGTTRIRLAPIVNHAALAFDPELASRIMQWMVDHRGEYRERGCDELNSTALAEAACEAFDLYGKYGAGQDETPEDLFELSGALALAIEDGKLSFDAE